MTKQTKKLSTEEKKYIEGLASEVTQKDNPLTKREAKACLLNKGQRDYLESCVKSFWEAKGAGSELRPTEVKTVIDSGSEFTLTHDWSAPADFNVYDATWYAIARTCCNSSRLSKPQFDLLLNDLEVKAEEINAAFGDDYDYELHLANAKLSMLFIFAWLSRRGSQFDVDKAGKCACDRSGNLYHRTNTEDTSAYTAGHGSWATVVSGVFNQLHEGNIDAVKVLG